jgi:uncharacterized membrane protein
MIVVGNRENGARIHILARGNFSLNANELILVLLALTAVTLGLAGLLALQGYWPVLMLALAQMILVVWLFIRVWKNAWVFEEIHIDAEKINIVRQRYRRRTRVCLDTAWAAIRLEQPAVAWHASKLILRCKDQQVELGAFLTDDEKLSLRRHLAQALAEHTAWRKY